LNNVATVVSLVGFTLFSLASCSGGGVEGTGSGAPYEILISRPDTNPAVIDTPDLECLGNVYDRPNQENQFETGLNPPAWMRGNWSGQRTNGQIITVVVTDNNVAFGTPEQQTTLVDGISNRSVIELASTNQVFRFTVNDTVQNATVDYTHEYSFIDSDQIEFSVTSDDYLDESVVMSVQSSTDLIRPPSWLLGEWRNDQCETRLFDSMNISIEFDNADPTISFANVLSGAEATFQTSFKDDSIYDIEATYLSSDGTQILGFRELYVLQDDGTVKHYTANRVQSLVRR